MTPSRCELRRAGGSKGSLSSCVFGCRINDHLEREVQRILGDVVLPDPVHLRDLLEPSRHVLGALLGIFVDAAPGDLDPEREGAEAEEVGERTRVEPVPARAHRRSARRSKAGPDARHRLRGTRNRKSRWCRAARIAPLPSGAAVTNSSPMLWRGAHPSPRAPAPRRADRRSRELLGGRERPPSSAEAVCSRSHQAVQETTGASRARRVATREATTSASPTRSLAGRRSCRSSGVNLQRSSMPGSNRQWRDSRAGYGCSHA